MARRRGPWLAAVLGLWLAAVALGPHAPRATGTSGGCPAAANGLACAAQRLVTIVLPGEAPSPDTALARITYTDTALPTDAQMQVVVAQAGSRGSGYASQLHAQSPGLTVLAYQSFWLRPATDRGGETTCLPGAGSYPSSWYLRGSSGAPELLGAGTVNERYAMDFANRDYLQACAQHALAVARAMGADGVFLDGAATSLQWAQLTAPCGPRSPTCTSDRAWRDAMAGALTYLGGLLHAHGLKLFANISGGNVDFCCGGGPAVWRRFLGPLDGALQESFTYGTDARPLPAREVAAGLANVAWDEAAGKLTILNDDVPGCAACVTYGVAAALLVAQGRTSYDIATGIYGSTATWWPAYTAASRLGFPLEDVRALPDGLLVRRFTHGTVLVNDTAAAVTDPAYGQLPPHAGVVRLSATAP